MLYDIFISYRREGGADKARILKTELTSRGYRVFLDFDELTDGIFNERIIKAIESAPIFMLLLSENALDRCSNENDWVRMEIEHAIKLERHIIPINPDMTFKEFPTTLPLPIFDKIKHHQMSEIMFGQLFKASIDKMIDERIKPIVSHNEHKPEHLIVSRKKIISISVIVIAVLAVAILASVLIWKQSTDTVLHTTETNVLQTTDPQKVTATGDESLSGKSLSKKEIKADIERTLQYHFDEHLKKSSQIIPNDILAEQNIIFEFDATINQCIKDLVDKYNPNDDDNLIWIKVYCDEIKAKLYTDLNQGKLNAAQVYMQNQQILTDFAYQVFEIYQNSFNQHYYDVVNTSWKDGMDKVYIEHKERAEAAAQPIVDALIEKYSQQNPNMAIQFNYAANETLKCILERHDNNMRSYEEYKALSNMW